MTISFPRALPAVTYIKADFFQIDAYGSSSAGRQQNVIQVRDTAWQADMVTRPLRYSVMAEVEAWWLSLRGGLRSCLFVHPHALWPKQHYAGNSPASDAGNLVSVSNGNVLSVESVDSGLSLSIGDRIGLEEGALRAIGRVVDFSGSGTTRSIEIEPAPPADVAVADAVVRFASPSLVMRPVHGSFSVSGEGLYTVSFSLIESRI